ncbi:cob(I)yrinic acid a,c-diamide adenosyltransferase [Herbaspirillum sp. RTI4]|uniref:cob(I)yrinic acid a,c-diamide adenosyltransferase n=1 Tax=Herbaspirillum sp. RTI4 TaxID=3048640 RepID=UPI002AB3C979|nr:cob(I)yrinic acid a,c-diamide adenosyltransferase [Herbaspirillum sp. RTI4]MDY7579531.1 cob(I)yrinic acid a,c-diamide adenosyltransferase [Herbaspirillum sp. RTI4]MEA9983159.1 cob(I)yrinic acid a,c-diamide adenosyltransferase [Herbaspirillum sp. RTI4]
MKTDDASHQRMTQRHKEGFEKKKAAAQNEKGLLIVYTGTGKGKSTAAFGMGMRILGHDMKLGVVQFIKGALHSAERTILGGHANCEFHVVGEGYTWDTQDRQADMRTAATGWEHALRMIADPSVDMVILDELNIVLKYGYLDIEQVLAAFAARRTMLHIVVTGRHAPQALIDAADLVSEIRPLKHPYKEQGIKAQKGVEF